MLTGQQIHLHQALGLGSTWVMREAQITQIETPVVTSTKHIAATVAETPTITQPLSISRSHRTPPPATALPIKTADVPVTPENVQHQFSSRAAALLAHIAKAQTHAPKTHKEAPNSHATTMVNCQADSLSQLMQQVSACQACELSQGRRQALTSPERQDCRLIVVLPQPSLQDDIHNQLLSDNEDVTTLWSKLITNVLALGPEQIYITSAIKCAPNLQLVAQPSHAAHCSTYLQRELQLLPQVPVLLLASNQQRLWQRLQQWATPERVFRIPHPSKMVRDPDSKKLAWETLKKLKTLL